MIWLIAVCIAVRWLKRFKPRFLPKQQTACLAMSMSIAETPKEKVDSPVDVPRLTSRGITRLVRTLEDAKSLAAELKHLRHEWHAFELTMLVQCLEDLLFLSNLDPVAYSHFPSYRKFFKRHLYRMENFCDMKNAPTLPIVESSKLGL
jgi:hypothetical protein